MRHGNNEISKHKYKANLLLSALFASKKAGDKILEVYKSDFGVEHKNDKSPLTIADKQSHQIILDQLLTFSPVNFPVLSEEGKDISFEERRRWDYFWLIDPLDGTKEFINRNGEFTVNIAMIQKKRPILGVIHVPAMDTFYYGAEGIGAYRLDSGVELSDIPDDGGYTKEDLFNEIIGKSKRLPIVLNKTAAEFTIIGSRSHMSKETAEYINRLKQEHGEANFISAGSSLKFCLLAEGKADVYPRFGPTIEWDTAAGHAIVEQAGGKVVDIETDKPLEYNKRNLLNPYFVGLRKGMDL